jgi:hypothetical protein
MVAKLIEAEEREQAQEVNKPAPPAVKVKPEEEPPHPVLTLARKALRRWDLSFECSGQQSWIQTTGTKRRVWLILQTGDEVTFEPLD